MDNLAFMPYLIIFFVSYLCGGIPFGLIIGKYNGIDVRSEGSGNIGATNILRICGKKWGYFCFVLDTLKGFIPVTISKNLPILDQINDQGYIQIIVITGVVMGHIWSPYIKFKGGKGVATSAGALLAVTPIATLISLFIWYIVFSISRYVSMASIIAAIVLPATAFLLNLFYRHSYTQATKPILFFLLILSVLVVLKHKENIKKLLNGTENKFSKKGPGKP